MEKPQTPQLRTGEFAKICGPAKHTPLRHNEIGLFSPAFGAAGGGEVGAPPADRAGDPRQAPADPRRDEPSASPDGSVLMNTTQAEYRTPPMGHS